MGTKLICLVISFGWGILNKRLIIPCDEAWCVACRKCYDACQDKIQGEAQGRGCWRGPCERQLIAKEIMEIWAMIRLVSLFGAAMGLAAKMAGEYRIKSCTLAGGGWWECVIGMSRYRETCHGYQRKVPQEALIAIGTSPPWGIYTATTRCMVLEVQGVVAASTSAPSIEYQGSIQFVEYCDCLLRVWWCLGRPEAGLHTAGSHAEIGWWSFVARIWLRYWWLVYIRISSPIETRNGNFNWTYK